MKQVPIRLGPLALLLTVVTICMAVLGILTFSTARADLAMAEKQAAFLRERYALEAEGQAFLQTVEKSKLIETTNTLTEAGCFETSRYIVSPQDIAGLTEEDGAYWTTLTRDSLQLKIGFQLRADTGDIEIIRWQYSGDWQIPEEIGGLWPGE